MEPSKVRQIIEWLIFGMADDVEMDPEDEKELAVALVGLAIELEPIYEKYNEEK